MNIKIFCQSCNKPASTIMVKGVEQVHCVKCGRTVPRNAFNTVINDIGEVLVSKSLDKTLGTKITRNNNMSKTLKGFLVKGNIK